MKPVKHPYPRSKRFNHACKAMQIAYPKSVTTDLLGTDASAIWSLRVAEIELVVFHCPFCGRDLNEQYSNWAGAGLWETK